MRFESFFCRVSGFEPDTSEHDKPSVKLNGAMHYIYINVFS